MDFGPDMGYHSVKAIGNGRAVVFESFAVRPVESMMSLNGHEQMLIASERTRGQWLVGPEAIKKGLRGARLETAAWIQSPIYLALFYTALAQISEASRLAVSLVTGLPILDYQRDKGVLAAALLGDHRFNYCGRGHQLVTVESVRVVPQGWGAVLAALFDDKGRVQDADLATQKVAVIDVGGHTVNYLAVRGLSDIPAQNRGTNRGAWNVVRAVKAHYDEHYPGLSAAPDHDVMRDVIAGFTYHGKERVDLVPITAPVISEIAQEIIDTAAQYWGQGAPTFRRVLVCGGGAYLFGASIRAAFDQAVVMERPEFANAQGYCNFAAYLSKTGGW